MLESLAAWVLKYFLGRYVENLNTDQLTIGLLQGEVELDNLPLKKEALRQVGLPVQVTAGFIGKVKLQIPFTQIRSAPWVIIIERIYLVAAPVNLQEWDEDAEEQALLEQKLTILDAIEAQWRSSTEGLDQGYYASSYTSWMNFGTSVVSNIVENLQLVGPVIHKRLPRLEIDPEIVFELNITDIHFRFEDNLTADHKYFSFGLVIESIVAQSCNENWELGFANGENSFKLLELSNLSIYWEDCDHSNITGNKKFNEFIDAMGEDVFRGSQFLVESVSGKVHMKKNRNADPLRSRLTPRIFCDIMFDEFSITLTDTQYSQMVNCLRSLEVLAKRITMRRIRPSVPVALEPRKWWHYCCRAVMEYNYAVGCKSWDFALKRARDNIAYVKMYENLLMNAAGPLSEELKNLKDRVESEQSLEELRALRVAAMLRVRPVSKASSPAPSANFLTVWFPQFWYSNDGDAGEPGNEAKLHQEFIEALENPMDDATYLRRDVIFGQFNFCLQQGTVTLYTSENGRKSVFELQLEKLNLGFEWRPRSSSFKINISLGAVFLKDKLTPNSIFPVLVSPQGREMILPTSETKSNLPSFARFWNRGSSPRPSDESLLHVLFEVKPFDSNVDYRVNVRTQSLDIVYNPAAFSWLTDFFTRPQQATDSHLRAAARRKYQALKNATKNELIKNWENILAGKLTDRKTWSIDLDISAPHIIFLEHFHDKNAVIVVVDLGKLHFSNLPKGTTGHPTTTKDSDEEEAFQTPCSTPPGSEASPDEVTLASTQLSEHGLRSMLYEHYEVKLGEMQVLVGRVKDSWKYAQLKGTSSLHVLDRFDISIQVDRRILYTTDPQYPSLTFAGKLPRLVVHLNEQKISAIRAVYGTLAGPSSPSPSPSSQDLPLNPQTDDSPPPDVPSQSSRLIIMQFTVQHLALEVQSRNRSVAELQVSGVRMGLTQRLYDTSLSLTVHSLLLVDAMQTFGRDFELLVASHKHVGMDSLSGSLRDSEPCSPTSPASPEPDDRLASPVNLSQALADLEGFQARVKGATSPVFIKSPLNAPIRPPSPDPPDSEALISIEVTLVSGLCPGTDGQPLQIVAIQFNNLDVIANQETIVELIGFVRRVFPSSKPTPPRPSPMPLRSPLSEESTYYAPLPTKTDATFDFHRLNVLLLRAGVRNGVTVGKKICTASMLQAKIKATIGEDVTVEGSLGGVQILDLTSEGNHHQRILSLGADPLASSDDFANLSAGLYGTIPVQEPAFSFCVNRTLKSPDERVDVKIRLASVWYTHSPMLLRELESCATEFKQYLSNLARSIRSAATEVALGLVHARAEALALSLSSTNRFSSSLYGGSNPDVSSPRKRRRSFTQSLENVLSTPHTPFASRPPQTPWSPDDEEILDKITLNLDVVLDSPVIVLPKSLESDLVFVAHLGKMTLKNSCKERENPWETRVDRYDFELRDMNVYSVVAASEPEVSISATGEVVLPKLEKVYSRKDGKPILHDSVIDLVLERSVGTTGFGDGEIWEAFSESVHRSVHYSLSGGLVVPLKLSLSRDQYQQIIETSEYLLTSFRPVSPDIGTSSKKLTDISEEESQFEFTYTPKPAQNVETNENSTTFKVTFEVPEFTVELLRDLVNEGALVSISFKDFLLSFEKQSAVSTLLKMSLKSLVMENLLADVDSKSRFLAVSSAEPSFPNRRFILSQSCPTLTQCPILYSEHSSLPENLSAKFCQTERNRSSFGVQTVTKEIPCTPPPSPRPRGIEPAMEMSRDDNLVLITIETDDSKTGEDAQRMISVDFNCVEVIADIESWVVVMDFFAIDGPAVSKNNTTYQQQVPPNSSDAEVRKSVTDVKIRGLTLTLIRPEYEVCKANISRLNFHIISTEETNIEGGLASMSLVDLSPHGKLYRERFLTTGSEALHVRYVRHGTRDDDRKCDSQLSIKMSSVVYVHTQRFLNEIYAYFNRFSHLHTLMAAMRSADSEAYLNRPSSRMLLSIDAGSPVLILPVASSSQELVVAELGELSVRNSFRRSGSIGTIATPPPEGTVNVQCLLDSMSIELVHMDLYIGSRATGSSDLRFGDIRINRMGPSLLPEKCQLKLQVDRNLDTHLSREVPDLTIQGTLSKLEAFLDLTQYKVIRGLLSYNIGENLSDLAYATPEMVDTVIDHDDDQSVWRSLSLNFNLLNVAVHLSENNGSLACVHFIKSRLVVDVFSDRSQDIDLVSAEILLTDTRYKNEPVNKRFNVFTNILQPMGLRQCSRSDSDTGKGKLEKKSSQESDEGAVQAEVHHRRRKAYSKTTILLHNMRVMAIFDWWEIVRDYIVQNLPEPSVSSDIFTKAPLPAGLAVKPADVVPFELKLNVTDSEIVLVEDTSAWDTNAIILKSTTVISYRPELLEKPLSCNLNHCEVFSCILGMEDETALSIIDPVTVNIEVVLRAQAVRGISDAVLSSDDRVLEVSLTSMNVRLSYHDFRMLAIMLESIPQQTKRARTSVTQREDKPVNVQNQIAKLVALGFDAADCAQALVECNGMLDDAALWLTQHTSVTRSQSTKESSPIGFHTVEVRIGNFSLVVIDDCRDADVPLLEISLTQLGVKQVLGSEGSARFSMTLDYYNRVLSGWEPFVEAWRCKLKWEQLLTSSLLRNRLQLEISSKDLVNVNITSTLLDLFTAVKKKWAEDYNEIYPARVERETTGLNVRRRSPFVPFALKNETGCHAWYRTLIKDANNTEENFLENDWVPIEPDQVVPLTFSRPGRSRHRATHRIKVHQIVVKVGVWDATAPVSVDKVGVVFRHAPVLSNVLPVDVPPARLVFKIALDGSARKLITISSALVIQNNLFEAVEAKLENTVAYPGVWDDTMCLQIPSNSSQSMPLSHAHAHIWIRPVDSVNLHRYHAFSSSPIGWMSVKNPRDLVHETHQCHNNRDNSFRFVAAIYHEDMMDSIGGAWLQPAHTISLYSPVVVTNLLPCDVHYSLRQNSAHGHIKPGMSANIHEVDHEQRIEINIHLDGFTKHGTISIPSPPVSFKGEVRVQDDSQRRLVLHAAVDVLEGAGVTISISAPYWVINKTSIPLVLRQEGSAFEAAGQGPETEVARVVSPLLFSLADSDGGPMAQVRVGNAHLPDSQPQWCQPFPLLVGTTVLRLRIGQRDRADVIYILGINIRTGKGRHRRTKIITFSPRFQLHNKSSYQLQFAQHCLATTLNDPAASATYCKAVPECSLAWHWPRLDRELFLCLRILDIRDCLWSGKFAIDNDDSFHINVRDVDGKMHFLRAEIVLQGATYFTVITDADNMPPPVRVDNCSQVAVEFYQADLKIETARTIVRPHSSVPYAWDLPHGSTQLTVVAPGGGCSVYEVNSSSYKSNATLTYENFIYIAFTTTFNHVDETGRSSAYESIDVESQQLVLDCVDGNRVVLNRKQKGQRSQLWCMTSEGQLQHEGSSPPRDPKSKSSRSVNTMVLDIAGTAPQPMQCVALVLRRPDPRRSSTQTWRFTDDGRLCCAHRGMCVQAKDGFFGLRQGALADGKWRMWSEVVLGPLSDDISGKGVPIEQAVSRMKMRPGSGCLVVSLLSDGPTRVLRIADPIDAKTQIQEWVSSVQQEDAVSTERELQLNLRLANGIGVSVVSREPPEELLYIHLKGIIMNIARTSSLTTFDCSIEDVQCDNQLFEPGCPVVLFVSRSYRDDEPKRHLPAILISAHKQHSVNINAHIFKHLIVTVKSFSLCIEELLLLKLFTMFFTGTKSAAEDAEESDFETQRKVLDATSVHAVRYYFGIIKFTPDQIRLSVVTSPKLPIPLQKVKKKLGLRLITFEDAVVELKEFKRRHPFETSRCLWGSVVKHFKTELTWKAAFILGTVDFLGNPFGLINDVSEGVTGLLTEGSVGSLVKNVTHGISDSAAKVTGSLSDGLGSIIILDESHEEMRQRIRKSHSGSSRDHLWAGVKGFGFGLLGGVTSVFKQTYEGAAQEGLQGLFAGFGKGLVGTVTKPVVGMLDFASETASAVRDSSRTSDRPPRVRLPRLVLGPGGLLPHYSPSQALGQDFLYTVNNRKYQEKLVWYEVLLSEDEDLRVLISNVQVLLVTSTAVRVAQYHLSSVSHSIPITLEDTSGCGSLHYIELVLHLSTGGISTHEPPKKRPRIRCDTRDIADRVCSQINYAQALFEESRYSVANYPNSFGNG